MVAVDPRDEAKLTASRGKGFGLGAVRGVSVRELRPSCVYCSGGGGHSHRLDLASPQLVNVREDVVLWRWQDLQLQNGSSLRALFAKTCALCSMERFADLEVLLDPRLVQY